MPWLKLDDQFSDHPKIVEAGPMAGWLHVCGMLYCSRLLTDGFIPAGQVRKLADLDNAGALADRLVEVGLWDRAEGGYQVHDYLDYNPSRAKVMAEREANAQRQGRYRDRHTTSSNTVSNAVTDTVSNDPPVPTPVPVPLPTPKPVRKPKPLAADKPPRERNPTWDALALLCGEPATKSEKSDFGLTVKELDGIDATGDEIAAFGPWWFQNHEGARLTHRCLRNHFGSFRNAPQRPPQITDIKSNLVRAIVTADFSENHAEIEAERDRRRAIQEQATRPRQLPVTPRGITAGE